MDCHVTMMEAVEGVAVWCDDLPGCCSQGPTRDEALSNLRETNREWLEAPTAVQERFGFEVRQGMGTN